MICPRPLGKLTVLPKFKTRSIWIEREKEKDQMLILLSHQSDVKRYLVNTHQAAGCVSEAYTIQQIGFP